MAETLTAQGHPVSDQTVSGLLRAAGYSLQANSKTREGRQHEDRDAQFRHIHDTSRRFLHADLALNEKALARTAPPDTPTGRYRPR